MKGETLAELKGIVDESQYFVQNVDYPLDYLKFVSDTIATYMEQNEQNTFFGDTFRFFIDEIANRIVVELEGDELRQIFCKEIITSPAISFRNSREQYGFLVNINAGSGVSKTTGARGSFGYRVSRNGGHYLISAAHGFALNDSALINGTLVGSCVGRAMSNCDAALILTSNSSYNPTNTVQGTSTVLSTSITAPAVNAIAFKRGDTTGVTSGTIYASSSSGTVNGNFLTDMVEVSYSSGIVGANTGDSGGVVYSSSATTFGAVCGGTNSGGAMLFSKASNILGHFQAPRY